MNGNKNENKNGIKTELNTTVMCEPNICVFYVHLDTFRFRFVPYERNLFEF